MKLPTYAPALAICLISAVAATAEIPGLPASRSFVFKAEREAVLAGTTGETNKRGKFPDLGEADQVADFGVLALWHQNAAYTDGRYNHNDFPVQAGTVAAEGGGPQFPAYRIGVPQRSPKEWLASAHVACFRFPGKADYEIHELREGALVTVGRVGARDVESRGFTPLRGIDLSRTAAPRTLVFVPSATGVSSHHPHGEEGVSGATVFDEAGVKITELHVPLPGEPYDTATGFPHGPSSHANQYSPRRRFFPVALADGTPGVVWQDRQTLKPHVTWLGEGYSAPRHFPLPNPNRLLLAAATSGPRGTLFLLLVGDGDGAKGNSARPAEIVRTDADGKNVTHRSLDTSKNGLNITAFGDSNAAALVCNGPQLGLIISRTMHRSGDGLNHQGAISLVLDPATLAVLKNHGQTSGHSFGNHLTFDAAGHFLGVDLGDAYPRGIHLHRFGERGRQSRVVYSFKTAHATKPGRAGKTFPRYDEISARGDTRYKWSNDNATYTELAGAVPMEPGIAVVFAGERSPGGRTMDNARALDRHLDPRNLAVILVRNDFHKTTRPRGSQAPQGIALSAGKAETGGFHDFGGGWQTQRHEGVVWVTDYGDALTRNASRIKAFRMDGGELWIVWEEWTANHYTGTRMMRLEAGKLTDPSFRPPAPLALPSRLRLGRRDDPHAAGSHAVFYSGTAAGRRLVVHLLAPGDPR